ncbi:MAG: hypothetical protein RIB03_01820 [Henriciella sp.]|uniref:hypothetical protein n=1 Tax=Henriciella sp. TaxID=1968823 RepID=UPI0032EE653E
MAYMQNRNVSVVAGIIIGGIGGYLGWEQAAATGVSPILGALIFGAAGFVVGMAGAFIFKSLAQFLVFLVLIGAIIYFAQDPITQMTGINPVEAVLGFLENFGIAIGDATGPDTGG